MLSFCFERVEMLVWQEFWTISSYFILTDSLHAISLKSLALLV